MRFLLHHYLEHTAASDGEREAFRDGETSISYAEADRRAGQIAAALRDAGVRRGDRVALFMARGYEACLAVFGILKAGASYVPLDPQAPLARVERILGGVKAAAAVVDTERARLLRKVSLPDSIRLVIGATPDEVPATAAALSWAEVGESSEQFVERSTTDQDLAYIIFTSGSTGAPKGIMHTHRSSLAYSRWAAAEYEVSGADRIGSFSPFHFDISIFDLFAARLSGATTVIVPQGVQMFPASCAELLERERINIVFTVPHALQLLSTRGQLSRRDLSSLRWLIYGGEPYPSALVRELMAHIPSTAVSNMYGPAEVNGVTAHHLHKPPVGNGPIPIGPPAANVEALVVDDDEKPVTPGEAGELYIRASSRMLGYWNGLGDPDREPFFDRDAGGGQQHRFYRTGDIVREGPDGSLVFAGRRDHLVKIRGHRIELAEVESALLSHPDLAAAAAFAMRDDDGAELVAAIERPSGDTVSASEIREHLRAHLSPYAIPSRLEFVDALPRTSTGKVDRPALQESFSKSMTVNLPVEAR